MNDAIKREEIELLRNEMKSLGVKIADLTTVVQALVTMIKQKMEKHEHLRHMEKR